MPVEHKFRTLAAYQLFAQTLIVYNSENFARDHNSRTISGNIFRAIAFTMLYSALIIGSLQNYWMIGTLEMGLSEIAYNCAQIIVQLQYVLTAIAMTIENRTVHTALAKLEQIVEKRKHVRNNCICDIIKRRKS